LKILKYFFTSLLSYEKIIRPTTKSEAIKGKLLKYQGTDYCEFLPQSQAGGGIVAGGGVCIQLTISDLQA